MKFVVTLAGELALERPVYMGSSIGGHLATDLALHHAEKFRAIIGLEAAIATPGGFDDIYNHLRPHSSLGALTPTELAVLKGQEAQPPQEGENHNRLYL